MKLIILAISFSLGLQSFSQSYSVYHVLKVRLTKPEKLSAGCGVLAVALTQKFEIIESNHISLKPRSFILLNKGCPELLSDNYFVKNKLYKVKITKESGTSFGWLVINNYEKEKLPLFWIQQINLIPK